MDEKIYVDRDGKRHGFGGGKDEGELLWQTNDSVWAISKSDAGYRYQLDADTYAVLVRCVDFARERASQTYDFLESIRRDVQAKKLEKEDGSLTGAGLFAEHFNLTTNMVHQNDDVHGGSWVLADSTKRKSCSKDDLWMAFKSAISVATLTSQGLQRRILLRGLRAGKKGHSGDAVGLVAFRFGSQARERGADTPARHQTSTWLKESLLDRREGFRQPASLKKDTVFANASAEAIGNIHVDYSRIPPGTGLLLRKQGEPPMPWIIIHEATHKFARTEDVCGGACYTERECRNHHWQAAVRNATHYERFMGIDWSKGGERSGTGWKYNVKKMRAESAA